MRSVLTFPDVRLESDYPCRDSGQLERKEKNVKTKNSVQLIFSSEAASMKCCRILNFKLFQICPTSPWCYSVFTSHTCWALEGVKHDTDVHDGGIQTFVSSSASEVVLTCR